MWLLNARTQQLEYFEGSNIPAYAIVSHRWEDGEVTFEQITGGKCKNERGYRKIDLSCRQVLREEEQYDELQAKFVQISHVWIDTCCIDKRSSAELAEAINSMYYWYENAHVCYAYLSDVKHGRAGSFEKSEWFTRGWTLQELLAPPRLRFYDQDWEMCGDRDTLREQIMDVSGIPVSALQGHFDPSRYCVAQKMSWAAQRKTTREEDRAYSLLGMFQVNMPLIYGEGQRAFSRLQQAIAQASQDLTIFAWQTPGKNSASTFFPPSPACFDWAGESIRTLDCSFPDIMMAGAYLSLVLDLIPHCRGPCYDVYVAPVCSVISNESTPSWKIMGVLLDRVRSEAPYDVYALKGGEEDQHHPLIEIPWESYVRLRQARRIKLHQNSFDFNMHISGHYDTHTYGFKIQSINIHQKAFENICIAASEDTTQKPQYKHHLTLSDGRFGVAGFILVEKSPVKPPRSQSTLFFLGFDFDFNTFCLVVQCDREIEAPPSCVSIPRLGIFDISLQSRADVLALVVAMRSTAAGSMLSVCNLRDDGTELHLMSRNCTTQQFAITDTGCVSLHSEMGQVWTLVTVDLGLTSAKVKPRLIGTGMEDTWYGTPWSH